MVVQLNKFFTGGSRNLSDLVSLIYFSNINTKVIEDATSNFSPSLSCKVFGFNVIHLFNTKGFLELFKARFGFSNHIFNIIDAVLKTSVTDLSPFLGCHVKPFLSISALRGQDSSGSFRGSHLRGYVHRRSVNALGIIELHLSVKLIAKDSVDFSSRFNINLCKTLCVVFLTNTGFESLLVASFVAFLDGIYSVLPLLEHLSKLNPFFNGQGFAPLSNKHTISNVSQHSRSSSASVPDKEANDRSRRHHGRSLKLFDISLSVFVAFFSQLLKSLKRRGIADQLVRLNSRLNLPGRNLTSNRRASLDNLRSTLRGGNRVKITDSRSSLLRLRGINQLTEEPGDILKV